MKKWFLERFLPMWAKETVYKDNRQLAGQLRRAREENRRLQAYIRGMQTGIKMVKKISRQGESECKMHNAK